MDSSIIRLQDYIAVTSWRKRDQLRGLLRNHADVVTSSVSLAAPGVVFPSAQIALHSTENAVAVALSPLSGPSAVGLMLLDEVPSLSAATCMQWLDLQESSKTSCVEWGEDLLLLGSTRGRVLVCDVTVDSCRESSGVLSPSGALTTGPAETAVSHHSVPPSAPAASTLVRSVHVNRRVCKTSVVGVKGASVYMWDLSGGALPVQQWAPHTHADAATPVMFAEWAPNSASVVLSGTYDGSVQLVDSRAAAVGNGVALRLPRAGSRSPVAHSGDFNALLPSLLALSYSDGTVRVYDVRFPLQPMQSMTTQQGDAVRLRWWRHNADLLTTAGSDGSVAFWNLRCSPTFCVGRAPYQLPMSDLSMTETFTEQRALAITIGGELTLTGLRVEALMGLAPSLVYGTEEEHRGAGGTQEGRAPSAAPQTPRRPVGEGEGEEETAIRKTEHDACGLLYVHQLKEAYETLARCASRRLAQRQADVAMQLVSHIDVVRVPAFDYNGFISKLHQAGISVAGDSTTAPEDNAGMWETIRQQYERDLLRCSSHLATTVPLHRIRALSQPNPLDVQLLEALRLNVLLHRVLDSDDVDQVVLGVRAALDLIATHPGISELIDIGAVEQMVRLLLRKNFAEGERFVQFLLSQLKTDGSPTTVSYQLLRAVMNAAQEPAVTMGTQTRVARRYVERFYRDMEAAKDAVLTQLQIQRLGVEHFREVIMIINTYQARCIRKGLPGMFGWIAWKPLVLFLHCLTADSNYVTFFWASVQYIETLAHFPGVREVEAVLFAVVDRIHSAALKVTDDVIAIADTTRFSIPSLRLADAALSTAHEFLVVLIRVQLECENVALARHMQAMPPVMQQVQDVLNTASEDVLDAWAGAIDALLECGQPDVVRRYCLASVRQFSEQMEDLMGLSAKGEADERLNEILDVCDDFFAAVGRRRAVSGGGEDG